MANTLIERRKDSLIVYRLTELEKDVEALKVNQQKILTFGNLVLSETGLAINGQNSISGTGLTSLNFPNAQIATSTSISTTNTSYQDISGSTMNPFTTSAPSTSAIVTVAINGRDSNNGGNGESMQVNVLDSVNGGIIDFPVLGSYYFTGFNQIVNPGGSDQGFITGFSYTSVTQLVSISAIIHLNPGTHTLKLQYKSNGGGVAFLNFFLINYIVIGQQLG